MFSQILRNLQLVGESILWRILLSVFLLTLILFAVIQLFLLLNFSIYDLEYGRLMLAVVYSVVGLVSLGFLLWSFRETKSTPQARQSETIQTLPSGQQLMIWLLQGLLTGYASKTKTPE